MPKLGGGDCGGIDTLSEQWWSLLLSFLGIPTGIPKFSTYKRSVVVSRHYMLVTFERWRIYRVFRTLLGHRLQILSNILEIPIKWFSCSSHQMIDKMGKPVECKWYFCQESKDVYLGDGVFFRGPFLLHPLGTVGLVSCFSVFLSDRPSGVFLFLGISCPVSHGPRLLCLAHASWLAVHSPALQADSALFTLVCLTSPHGTEGSNLWVPLLIFPQCQLPWPLYQHLPMCVSNPSQRRQDSVSLLTFPVHHR